MKQWPMHLGLTCKILAFLEFWYKGMGKKHVQRSENKPSTIFFTQKTMILLNDGF